MERSLLAVPPMVNRPVAEYHAAGFQKSLLPVNDAECIVGREIVALGLLF